MKLRSSHGRQVYSPSGFHSDRNQAEACGKTCGRLLLVFESRLRMETGVPARQSPSPVSDLDAQRLRLFSGLGSNPVHFFDVGASDGCSSGRVSEAFHVARFDRFESPIDRAPDHHERMEGTLALHPRFCLRKTALGVTCKRT